MVRRKFTDEELLELHAKELKQKEVVQLLNCGRTTVSRHAKRLGLSFFRYRNKFGIRRMEGETPKEYRLRYNRVWYHHNKERRRKTTREWRLKNPEKVREQKRRYRL